MNTDIAVQTILLALLRGEDLAELDEALGTEDSHLIDWAQTFEDAGVMTNNAGLVVDLATGAQVQISIVVSREAAPALTPEEEPGVVGCVDCGESHEEVLEAGGSCACTREDELVDIGADSCPGCRCVPGEGRTATCAHPDGCGFDAGHDAVLVEEERSLPAVDETDPGAPVVLDPAPASERLAQALEDHAYSRPTEEVRTFLVETCTWDNGYDCGELDFRTLAPRLLRAVYFSTLAGLGTSYGVSIEPDLSEVAEALRGATIEEIEIGLEAWRAEGVEIPSRAS
jgi:hypothetical protein